MAFFLEAGTLNPPPCEAPAVIISVSGHAGHTTSFERRGRPDTCPRRFLRTSAKAVHDSRSEHRGRVDARRPYGIKDPGVAAGRDRQQ